MVTLHMDGMVAVELQFQHVHLPANVKHGEARASGVGLRVAAGAWRFAGFPESSIARQRDKHRQDKYRWPDTVLFLVPFVSSMHTTTSNFRLLLGSRRNVRKQVKIKKKVNTIILSSAALASRAESESGQCMGNMCSHASHTHTPTHPHTRSLTHSQPALTGASCSRPADRASSGFYAGS